MIHRSKRSYARVGRITTPHGVIDTPNFVGVGTNGTLKALDNRAAQELGLQLMFCNTYHLLLQPGTEIIRRAGGLHAFMQRSLPLITDSGGFQVFSLCYGSVADELKKSGGKARESLVLRIDEEGVLFRSYRDGRKILLTPESSVAAQKDLGADIIIPFDELPPYHVAQDALQRSLERTHRWEQRSLDAHLAHPKGQAMYGVIHGGVDPALRALSCRVLRDLPFDGFAIGGSMGKTKEEMACILQTIAPLLPQEKPNHLLGIGDLASIALAVPLGIDTLDSSYPTRAARHGLLLTKQGPIKLEKAEYKEAFRPIEPDCDCATCQHYSLAYMHHLFKAREIACLTLATLHNMRFMVRTMETMREQILRGSI